MIFFNLWGSFTCLGSQHDATVSRTFPPLIFQTVLDRSVLSIFHPNPALATVSCTLSRQPLQTEGNTAPSLATTQAKKTQSTHVAVVYTVSCFYYLLSHVPTSDGACGWIWVERCPVTVARNSEVFEQKILWSIRPLLCAAFCWFLAMFC